MQYATGENIELGDLIVYEGTRRTCVVGLYTKEEAKTILGIDEDSSPAWNMKSWKKMNNMSLK